MDTRLPYPTLVRSPARLRDGQLVENGTGRRRHERLRQQCEISDRLGQRVEDGPHPGFVGLAQRPGRLPVDIHVRCADDGPDRSEEHTSELQSLMRISYAVFCLKKTTTQS